MSKRVLSTAALALISSIGSAAAADMPLKAPPPAIFSWSGFYGGLHAGGALGHNQTNDLDEVPGQFTTDADGGLAGGQFGFNIQSGQIVWGVEADVSGVSFNSTSNQPFTGNIIRTSVKGGFDWDATGRLGVAWDRALLYVKGGYADFGGSVTDIDVGEATVTKKGFQGWTLGGGVEHMISPGWSMKVEYLYSDFPSFTTALPTDGDRYVNKLYLHTVKFGINYQFGGFAWK